MASEKERSSIGEDMSSVDKDYENNEKIEIKKISNAVNFCVLFAFALDFMML